MHIHLGASTHQSSKNIAVISHNVYPIINVLGILRKIKTIHQLSSTVLSLCDSPIAVVASLSRVFGN